jgi:hypothetical protein
VIIIKERLGREANEWEGNHNGERPQKRRRLVERGSMQGEPQRRCLGIVKRIVEGICDEGGVPLELSRFLTTAGLRRACTLPLDEETGVKLSLIFKLQERMQDVDRVELVARRVERFTREEAGYWYSRLHSFGLEANRWAAAGMRVMLGGQPRDPGVGRMLERLRNKRGN